MAASDSLRGISGKLGDLKRRLWFLLLALIVYRIGAHVPVPGIDPVALKDLFESQQGGILGMFNMFSGRRAFPFFHLCAWDHAVYFGVDHYAVGYRCVSLPRGFEKRR